MIRNIFATLCLLCFSSTAFGAYKITRKDLIQQIYSKPRMVKTSESPEELIRRGAELYAKCENRAVGFLKEIPVTDSEKEEILEQVQLLTDAYNKAAELVEKLDDSVEMEVETIEQYEVIQNFASLQKIVMLTIHLAEEDRVSGHLLAVERLSELCRTESINKITKRKVQQIYAESHENTVKNLSDMASNLEELTAKAKVIFDKSIKKPAPAPGTTEA